MTFHNFGHISWLHPAPATITAQGSVPVSRAPWFHGCPGDHHGLVDGEAPGHLPPRDVSLKMVNSILRYILRGSFT